MFSHLVNMPAFAWTTLISFVLYLFRTPLRIRKENHSKLRVLLEAIEQQKSPSLLLLLFRDFMRNNKVSLSELKLLTALEDIPEALERYRFTGGNRSILNVTSSGFYLKARANSGFKRWLLSCWALVKYFFFVLCLVFIPLLVQAKLLDHGVNISLAGIDLAPDAFFPNLESLFFPAILFLMLMFFLLYMTVRQLSQGGNISSEARFYHYYVCKREEQTIRALIAQLRTLAEE
ncbi:hypothetical protein FHU10_4477 [Serratia fonticola]|jgi:hypothetical protein|uniref:Uncharacterized protein n=1 Tax=Serratia fonticola TaxID=47917 RepID=A0A542BQ65_SERFO|nr:hypothetical protein [Serratia fonticola]TQI80647.1 hypothetical protein FHU09_3226 [Serratia fonticola]TQI97328.1 hypothetical protein FHU11_2818 [Serratia fonticola]TVZ71824.1 hypothetical protein FHU10_4477 [Serratia fonticola]